MNKFINIRHQLHRHPELSGKEYRTQECIRTFIQEQFGLSCTNVANTGLICRVQKHAEPHVLIRVDIDALPIQEINDELTYQSTVDGVSHKCGHDGHTAIGLATIEKLLDNPVPNIGVSILFQPAEEIGEGAEHVIQDKQFNIADYSFALALHNIPGIPMHQIVCKPNAFTTAVQSIQFMFEGKTTHAGKPLKGNNPAYCISEIISWAKKHELTDEADSSYLLYTPIYSLLGSKDYGIAAGAGELHFTVRSHTQAHLDEKLEELTTFTKERAQVHQLSLTEKQVATFKANQNDPAVVKAIIAAAKSLDINYQELKHPFSWGEDFGYFTQLIPGAMFGLGAGEQTPELHNPDYNFPDELIATGASVFYEAIKQLTHV